MDNDNNEVKQFEMIALEDLIPPKVDMRSSKDKNKLEALAKSIETQGLLHPIVVRRFGGKFEIVAGHRRTQAFKLLKRKKILARVIETAEATTLFARYAENMARKDVSALEESAYLAEIQAQTGRKATDIAKEIGRSDSYVSERLAIQDWPDILKNALSSGKISFSVAREFAKFPEQNALRQFLEYALTSGCNPAQARRWRRMAQKAAEDVPLDSGEIDDLPQELPPPPLLSYFGRYQSYHSTFRN